MEIDSLQKTLDDKHNRYMMEQRYEGILKHLGVVEIKSGYRIITNPLHLKNSEEPKAKLDWIAVCYGKEKGEVYVCESIMDSEKNSIGWYKRWKGKKYLDLNLTYEGEFMRLMKHSFAKKYKSVEYLYNGQEIFVGDFKYNKRHTTSGTCFHLSNPKRVMVLEGCWDNSLRQGPFQKTIMGEAIEPPKQKHYYNDILVEKNMIRHRELREAEWQPIDRFETGISVEGVNSLTPGSCLRSEVLDLFFKHFNFSFEQWPDRNKNMRALTVFMFEKMVPSGKIASNAILQYKPLELMGKVFKNITSIFEVYPLILLPLNREQSHFAIGAISTKVTRNISSIEKVEFQLFYYDSLLNSEDWVINHLKKYITQEIKTHVLKDQQSAYTAGLDNMTKIMYSKTNRFTGQNNVVDCGIFTCIYGVLLCLKVCSKIYKIDWNWDESSVQVVAEIRKLIKIDAQEYIQDFMENLLTILEQKKIITREELGRTADQRMNNISISSNFKSPQKAEGYRWEVSSSSKNWSKQ